MRWNEDQDLSTDIEDRRGEGGGGGFGAGPRLGCGGIVIVGILSLLFRTNLFAALQDGEPAAPRPTSTSRAHTAADDKLVHFVSFVLDDVQETWTRELPAAGATYSHAKLVLFTDDVRSGCGFAETAMGPFYCPADQKVYIDLGFYRELESRFGAPGDFAKAYVIAHEVGHHVQNILGIEESVRRKQRVTPTTKNELSVRMELQADCFAGIWGHSTRQRHLLDTGDLESALGAAAAVGDDRLQRQATGHVNPERWTHGSSRQRAYWFKRGFDTGKVDQCDTFTNAGP
jgi:uncharacterized protein